MLIATSVETGVVAELIAGILHHYPAIEQDDPERFIRYCMGFIGIRDPADIKIFTRRVHDTLKSFRHTDYLS